jgi:nuclear transport factor 2 (NTF2) superfamily protein
MNHSNHPANDEQAVQLLQKAYAAFNTRQIDQVLTLMHTDVAWPNGWEGGYVHGHDEVRAYWERQWAAIDPHVDPMEFIRLPDGRMQVKVHQLVKDLQGNVILDGTVLHIYTIENGLVRIMEIV